MPYWVRKGVNYEQRNLKFTSADKLCKTAKLEAPSSN